MPAESSVDSQAALNTFRAWRLVLHSLTIGCQKAKAGRAQPHAIRAPLRAVKPPERPPRRVMLAAGEKAQRQRRAQKLGSTCLAMGFHAARFSIDSCRCSSPSVCPGFALCVAKFRDKLTSERRPQTIRKCVTACSLKCDTNYKLQRAGQPRAWFRNSIPYGGLDGPAVAARRAWKLRGAHSLFRHSTQVSTSETLVFSVPTQARGSTCGPSRERARAPAEPCLPYSGKRLDESIYTGRPVDWQRCWSQHNRLGWEISFFDRKFCFESWFGNAVYLFFVVGVSCTAVLSLFNCLLACSTCDIQLCFKADVL